MQAFPGRAFLAVLASTALLSCTDGNRPTDLVPGGEGSVSLAVVPTFAANLVEAGAQPINRIRITVLQVPGDAVVSVHQEDVDPAASEWELEVEVTIPPSGVIQVRLLIELIHVTVVGGVEVESVEWSALTGTLTLTVGQSSEITEVEVQRGPRDNLSVTAISVGDPGPVVEGDVVALEATVTTDDPGATPTVFWSSSNESLATVDDAGVVTTLLPGEVDIVATAGSHSAAAHLVILPRPDGISVSPESLMLEHVGAEGTIMATVVDPRGDPIEAEVLWSVSDPTVLVDLGEGSVRALAPGTSLVTATVASDASLSASAMVLVEQVPSSVTVTPEEAELTALGQQVQFAAVVTDLEGTVIPGVPVTWRSSDPLVASVAPTGLVTAVSPGAATIFADVETGRPSAAGGAAETVIISGSATVVVEQTVVTVTVTPATVAFTAVGQTAPLTATALDGGGSPVAGVLVEWETSNAAVASVSPAGVVTAVGPGTATITASAEGASGTATVTVTVVSTPVDRAYTTAGNTQLLAGIFPPPKSPTVKGSSLLETTPGLTVTSVGTFPTANGGSVTIEPDGSFLYTPPLGSGLTDSFTYTVMGGAMATVTITIVDMVWYVDNRVGLGVGTGASQDPFGSFVDLVGSGMALAGHTIFVHRGDGTTLHYDSGITLLDNQKLIGEGMGLTVPGAGTIVPAGLPPLITNTALLGDAVNLGNGNSVEGLTIQAPQGNGIHGVEIFGGTVDQVTIVSPVGSGVLMEFVGGTFTFDLVDVSGAGARGVWIDGASASFTFNTLSISGSGNDAFLVLGSSPTVVVNVGADGIVNTTALARVLNFTSTAGGSITFNGGPITDTNGSGIDIFFTAGTITVNSPVTITNPGGTGVGITGATAPVTFADLNVVVPAPPLVAVPSPARASVGPLVDSTADAARLGGVIAGVNIQSTTGTVTFGTLNVSTGNERALNISSSGTVRVTDPASTLESSLFTVLDVFSAGLDMTFASVSSSDSPLEGVRLNSASGTLTMNGGGISNSTGPGVSITNSTVTSTYNGAVTSSPSSRSVDLQNNTGGTHTFGGLVTDMGQGINLVNNTGATMNFNGGLNLSTGANPGLNATGGGILNASGVNIVNSTLGTGVNIQNTTIGGGGVTFESISVNGAPNGINLTNTGSGSFQVTGTGLAGSGGLITNTTGNGIDVSGSSAGSALTFMDVDVTGATGHGINLNNNDGTFTFDGVSVTNNGSLSGHGLLSTDHRGVLTIDNSTFSGNTFNNVQVQSNLGTFTLNVRNNALSFAGFKGGGTGLDILTGTTASGTANVSGNTFSGNGLGVRAFAEGSSTLDLTVNGSNTFSSNTEGIQLGNTASGTLVFDVMGNTFSGNSFSGLSLLGTGPGGALRGSITGNTLTGPTFRGIDLLFDLGADGVVRTSGNNFSGVQTGVASFVGASVLPPDNSTLDLTVDTEIIALELTSTLPGIDVNARQASTLCTNIVGNNVTPGGTGSVDIGLGQFHTSTVKVEGLPASPPPTATDVEAFLNSVNVAPNTSLVTLTTSILGVPSGTCRVP